MSFVGQPANQAVKCDCQHPSSWHRGTDRSGSPLADSRCKICVFCDYYIPSTNYRSAE